MTDHPQNDQFHASSFLQGANSGYVEQMYARFAADPQSVDATWATFFRSLGDQELDVKKEAAGASWGRADWPPQPADDLTAALTGEWPTDPKAVGEKIRAKTAEAGVKITDDQLKRAVLDSLRALMLIRAYRIRGHLAADLDPLGLADRTHQPELDPASYGFTEADMDRKIYLDKWKTI